MYALTSGSRTDTFDYPCIMSIELDVCWLLQIQITDGKPNDDNVQQHPEHWDSIQGGTNQDVDINGSSTQID